MAKILISVQEETGALSVNTEGEFSVVELVGFLEYAKKLVIEHKPDDKVNEVEG
jgi:hypothetical protein